ncbi:MAG TPA: hypothetical protein VFP10_08205, partial [Candidatus Eisenbacteria bacterium]|nr:hypothetical protein [Candidatus Eisenbacteria bacterium]
MSAGQRPEARERALEALALAEASKEPEAEGVAAQTLGYLDYEAAQLELAEGWASRATSAFERAGRPEYSRAITLRSLLKWGRGETQEAERLNQDAIRAAVSAGDRHAQEELRIHAGGMQIHLGRWNEAILSQEFIARIGIEDARLTKVPGARATLAIMEGLTGKPQAARKHAEQAIRLSRIGRPGTEPDGWRALAQAHRVRGRLSPAERAIHRAMSYSSMVGRNEHRLQLLELAKIRFAQRNWVEARRLASKDLGELGPDSPIEVVFLALLVARSALRLQETESAITEGARVGRWLESNPRPYVRALALQLQAEIAFFRQEWNDGVRLGQESLNSFTALPAPHDRASAALDMAELVPMDQKISEVARWLEEAAESFKRVGDRIGRERALAHLVERLKVSDQPTTSLSRGDRGLLERVSWLLNSLTDLRELAQRAMRMVVEQLDADRGVLLLIDRETGQIDAIAEHGAVDAKVRNEAMRYSRRVVQRVTESGGAV